VFYLLDRHPPAPGTGNESVKSLELATDEVTTDGDITLQDVTFAYPTRPETLALNRCSLEIKSGSIVALVGHSGCGSK
jgi:ABC-type bacteriocin/lantibiotic exporter with double-glycine peptidase domain